MTIPTSRVPLRVSEVSELQRSREEGDEKGDGDRHSFNFYYEIHSKWAARTPLASTASQPASPRSAWTNSPVERAPLLRGGTVAR